MLGARSPDGRSLTALLALGLLLVAGLWSVGGADPADVIPSRDRAAHLAAMKARTDEPTTLSPMTIAALFALPRPPRAYTQAQLSDIIARERRGVSVIGFVARVDPKRDGDFHVQITVQPPRRCLRHTTSDQLITELTPQFQIRRPAYSLDALRALCGTATQVRISGWLLYDAPHDRDWWRSTGWEVHPVTRIEVCCWRELE
jgi:hypothetical protein